MTIASDKEDLVNAIVGMPFGKLMEVAYALVQMNEDKECDRNIKTPLGMAQTLYDWAESEVEND